MEKDKRTGWLKELKVGDEVFLIQQGRWYGDGLSRTYQIDITKEFLQYYKVIGNIYENPELLKNKEE